MNRISKFLLQREKDWEKSLLEQGFTLHDEWDFTVKGHAMSRPITPNMDIIVTLEENSQKQFCGKVIQRYHGMNGRNNREAERAHWWNNKHNTNKPLDAILDKSIKEAVAWHKELKKAQLKKEARRSI